MTPERYEVHVVWSEGQGGVGYQMSEGHCRNVGKFLSKLPTIKKTFCSYQVPGQSYWHIFAEYVNGRQVNKETDGNVENA